MCATRTHSEAIFNIDLCTSDLRRGLKNVRTSRNRCQVDSALLHALGVHAHGRADRALCLGDRGIAQLARPAALADPVGRRAGRPVDPGVALQADDVVEAQLAEELEQLGVGEAGQDSRGDAVGQHLGQPAQAGILAVVAGILQLVLEHAEPDQRRRPAVTSLSARCPSASKSVQSIATTTSRRAPTISGTQVAKTSQASSLRLLSSRSTCLMACLGRRPRAWAKDLPMSATPSDAPVITPRVAFARESTRLV